MASDDRYDGGGGFYDLRWTRRPNENTSFINFSALAGGSQGITPIYNDNPINPVPTDNEDQSLVEAQDTQIEKPKPTPTPEPETTPDELTYVNQQEEVKAPEPEIIVPVTDQGRGVDKAFSSKVEAKEEDDDGWFYQLPQKEKPEAGNMSAPQHRGSYIDQEALWMNNPVNTPYQTPQDAIDYWRNRQYPAYTGGDFSPRNVNPAWSPQNQQPPVSNGYTPSADLREYPNIPVTSNPLTNNGYVPVSDLRDYPNIPETNNPVSYANDWRTLIDQWENAESANNELFRESLRNPVSQGTNNPPRTPLTRDEILAGVSNFLNPLMNLGVSPAVAAEGTPGAPAPNQPKTEQTYTYTGNPQYQTDLRLGLVDGTFSPDTLERLYGTGQPEPEPKPESEPEPTYTYEDYYHMLYDYYTREQGASPQEAASLADQGAKSWVDYDKPVSSPGLGETLAGFTSALTGRTPVDNAIAESAFYTAKPVAKGLWNSFTTWIDPEGELSPISDKNYIPPEKQVELPGSEAGIQLAIDNVNYNNALDNALESGMLPEEAKAEAERVSAGNMTAPEHALRRAEDLEAQWGIAPKTGTQEPNPVNPVQLGSYEADVRRYDNFNNPLGPDVTMPRVPDVPGSNLNFDTAGPWANANALFESLPDTMSPQEKMAYIENLFRQGKDAWNYRDARDGVLPENWAIPTEWYDSEGKRHFNPAMQSIMDMMNDTSTWVTKKKDGKEYKVPPITWDQVLDLWVKPGDFHEPGDAWRGLEDVPEECLAILASDPRAGAWFYDEETGYPSNFKYYTNKGEYFNGTAEEYDRLTNLFIDSVPALKTLIGRGVITAEDVARFFFKKPRTTGGKPKGGSYGYGAGYGRYGGGGGGGYGGGGGGGYRASSSTPSSGTNQKQNRVYNIMKNWSF